MSELLGLFPTPVVRKKWEDSTKYNSDMTNLFYSLENSFKNDKNSDLTNNYFTSYNKTLDKPLIEYNEMYPFVNFLSNSIKELNQFMDFDGTKTLKIRDMWFAINRKGSYHETHNHSPATWSGVYYVQATENDAKLNFYSPTTSNNHWANNVINNFNDFTTNQASFTPETGMLNIFPGWLNHSVSQQQVEQDRIAISFNVV